MTNLELLKLSSAHPNPLIDPYYNKGEIVLTPTSATKNKLMISNGRLIELITVFNYLDKEGRRQSDAEIAKVVDEIITILDTTEGINFSAFSQFFMVYNSAYSSYQTFSLEKKRDFIYQMLKLYCKERHNMYLSHGYTDSILQVMADNYSHKRNSKASIIKIVDLLKEHNVSQERTAEGLIKDSSFYFLPDKGDRNLFSLFLTEHAIVMQSASTEQGKLPDMVLKLHDEYFIIEAKMMKGSGGGQDKQLVEIINFVRYSETNPHIHYLTYLDGEYADMLFSTPRSPKLQRQFDDIVKCLNENPGNYFVNPAGFKLLIKDLLES